MHHEIVGQKGLFNGVRPRAWRLEGKEIHAENLHEVEVVQAMVSMGRLNGAKAAEALSATARLLYSTPEDAQAAFDELSDPTVE